jgi:hypothetical protein
MNITPNSLSLLYVLYRILTWNRPVKVIHVIIEKNVSDQKDIIFEFNVLILLFETYIKQKLG